MVDLMLYRLRIGRFGGGGKFKKKYVGVRGESSRKLGVTEVLLCYFGLLAWCACTCSGVALTHDAFSREAVGCDFFGAESVSCETLSILSTQSQCDYDVMAAVREGWGRGQSDDVTTVGVDAFLQGSTPVFLRAILWVVNGLYLGTRLLQSRDVEVNPGPLESPPESLTRRHPEEPLMTWSGGEPGQSAQTIAGLQTPREDATRHLHHSRSMMYHDWAYQRSWSRGETWTRWRQSINQSIKSLFTRWRHRSSTLPRSEAEPVTLENENEEDDANDAVSDLAETYSVTDLDSASDYDDSKDEYLAPEPDARRKVSNGNNKVGATRTADKDSKSTSALQGEGGKQEEEGREGAFKVGCMRGSDVWNTVLDTGLQIEGERRGEESMNEKTEWMDGSDSDRDEPSHSNPSDMIMGTQNDTRTHVTLLRERAQGDNMGDMEKAQQMSAGIQHMTRQDLREKNTDVEFNASQYNTARINNTHSEDRGF
ncbi:hypothetical protein ACOMHN_012348 [Nucella lapillus]